MTVQEVITIFQRRYPACEDARALQIFNAVHRELCSRSQIRNYELVLEVAEDVAQYDYDASVIVKIHEGYWETGEEPGDRFPLFERSTDEYAVYRRGWRMIPSSSQPTEYYVTSAPDGNTSKGQIGIWMKPDQTTDGVSGYPRCRFYTTTIVPLETDDNIPPQLLNENVYVYGMWAKWLMEDQDADPRTMTLYRDLAEKEMNSNVTHIKSVQTNKEETLLASPMALGLTRVK